MNKRVIVGETAGLLWLCADAAWAIGDRMKLENTGLVATLFISAIAFGAYFVHLQVKE